jgi:5-dehydro-2-deoxygluconokinase
MTAFDLICIGRASLDLFSADIGAPFEDITKFHAFVGGTPLNVAVGARRMGLKTALLTGASDDGVGRLVRRFLREEGVSTDYMSIKFDSRTNAFLLAIQPPDQFEATAYQVDSADLMLNIDDVLAAPITEAGAILFTGMGALTLSNHSATLAAAEIASEAGVTVMMDLDFRDHQWPDPKRYGVFVRGLLRLTDLAIGTEEEFRAATGIDNPEVAAQRILGLVREAVVVKRGERGAEVITVNGARYSAPVFPATIVNVFGAGDAFAAGLLSARLRGADWPKALRTAAACGALIVGRHGCANDMPTHAEVEAFLTDQDATI